MDLHDLGTLIWAIVVVIAVISSVVRSAKRTIERATPAQRPFVQAPPPPAPVAPVQAVRPPAPPVVQSAPRVVTIRRAAPAIDPTPEPAPLPVVAVPAEVPPRRSWIFGKRGPLVQGIIALEVLGPPRSLREWTPRV